MDVYTLTLTAGDTARLFVALGTLTGVHMKDGEFDAAQQCLALARAIHEQKEYQDGKASSVAPNAIPTDGND